MTKCAYVSTGILLHLNVTTAELHKFHQVKTLTSVVVANWGSVVENIHEILCLNCIPHLTTMKVLKSKFIHRKYYTDLQLWGSWIKNKTKSKKKKKQPNTERERERQRDTERERERERQRQRQRERERERQRERENDQFNFENNNITERHEAQREQKPKKTNGKWKRSVVDTTINKRRQREPFVPWLLHVLATCSVHLRDGWTLTIVHAATLRQKLQIFFSFFFFCVLCYIHGVHHFGWDFCVCDHF